MHGGDARWGMVGCAPFRMAGFSSISSLNITLVVKGGAERGVEDDDVLLFCCKVLVGKVGLGVGAR